MLTVISRSTTVALTIANESFWARVRSTGLVIGLFVGNVPDCAHEAIIRDRPLADSSPEPRGACHHVRSEFSSAGRCVAIRDRDRSTAITSYVSFIFPEPSSKMLFEHFARDVHYDGYRRRG